MKEKQLRKLYNALGGKFPLEELEATTAYLGMGTIREALQFFQHLPQATAGLLGALEETEMLRRKENTAAQDSDSTVSPPNTATVALGFKAANSGKRSRMGSHSKVRTTERIALKHLDRNSAPLDSK